MKIVRCLGGLGNQMFQYAFYLALKKNFPNAKIDLSGFNDYPLHNGFELERIFSLYTDRAQPLFASIYYTPERKWIWRKLRRLMNMKNAYYEEKIPFSFQYDLLVNDQIKYYWGYWQNPAYFITIAEEIKNAFKFKIPLDEKNQQMLTEIHDTISVAVHIRRGDYIKDPFLGGLCGEEYYKAAIHNMELKTVSPKYFIFSDDISWCEENLKLNNCTYISWNKGSSSYIDMQLMSACKHNIIANSSFSWWGAWLNNNPTKVVIGPNRWVNDAQLDVSGLFPDQWISL